MPDRTLEELKYDADVGEWVATRPFPCLARFVSRADAEQDDGDDLDPEVLQREIEEKLKGTPLGALVEQSESIFGRMQELAEKYGIGEEDESEEEQEQLDRLQQQQERDAELARQGLFRVVFQAAENEGPTAAQRKAFEHFLENESAICRNVIDAVFRFYCWISQDDPDWLEFNDCPEIDSPDELEGLLEFEGLFVQSNDVQGMSLLGFSFSCQWEEEHGLAVATHGDTVIEVGEGETAWSGPDDAESIWTKEICTKEERKRIKQVVKALRQAAKASAGQHALTPHDQLIQALLAADDRRIAKLIAAGADINALEYPPLFLAIDQMDPELVQRMLDVGADPTRKKKGKTALQHAERKLNDMKFTGEFVQAFGGITDPVLGEAAERTREYRQKSEEIVRLLRQALSR